MVRSFGLAATPIFLVHFASSTQCVPQQIAADLVISRKSFVLVCTSLGAAATESLGVNWSHVWEASFVI